MSWLGFCGFVVVAGGAFGCGWASVRRFRAQAPVWACGFLIPLVSSAILRRNPELEAQLFDPALYAYIRPWMMFVFGLGFLGAAIPQIKRRREQVVMGGFAATLFGIGSLLSAAGARLDTVALTGQLDPESDVCEQSSSFSCGAAAATTLLTQLGVATDEAEMAELCLTNPLLGTDEFGILKGLDEKLRETPYEVRIAQLETRDLRGIDAPAMASLRLGTFVGHWVVVLDHDTGGVTLGDPMLVKSATTRGVTNMSWDAFDELFDGLLIQVEDASAASRR